MHGRTVTDAMQRCDLPPITRRGMNCANRILTCMAAVRPTGERVCVAGKLGRERQKRDLNVNPSLRYDPFTLGAVNVKHEFPHITSVHAHVQNVQPDSLERDPAWLGQIQRRPADPIPLGLSRARSASHLRARRKGGAPILGRRERRPTCVLRPSRCSSNAASPPASPWPSPALRLGRRGRAGYLQTGSSVSPWTEYLAWRWRGTAGS